MVGLFSEKAKLWSQGRKRWEQGIRAADLDRPIWFHCASVGEFEQARPVIEMLKSRLPQKDVLVTFYSPSGFELRKNYVIASHVAYLPIDTPRNMKKWVAIVQPSLVVFTKYDFWFNLMQELKERSIPMIAISVHLPSTHAFFRWPGNLFLPRLGQFEQLFLQDESTAALLAKAGIESTTVAGDTRVDRVLANTKEALQYPALDRFSAAGRVVVAGSLWAADSALLLQTGKGAENNRWIVAPHERSQAMLKAWSDRFGDRLLHWTNANAMPEIRDNHRVIYVDFVGLLSKLYRYGQVAYVGGGFGSGIHNILEPAAYGLPVIFGPKNARFQEAQELKQIGLGHEVADEVSLSAALSASFSQEDATAIATEYFERQRGASEKIVKYVLEAHFEA